MLNYSAGAVGPPAQNNLFGLTQAGTSADSFLPQITKRGASQRQVVSGKGVDDLYSYYNKEMLALRDEMKNL